MSSSRGITTLPDIEELRCLIGWPVGTNGYREEEQLLRQILELSEQYGIGRLHQMVEWARDIWYHPEKIPEYEKMRRDRLKFLDDCRRVERGELTAEEAIARSEES